MLYNNKLVSYQRRYIQFKDLIFDSGYTTVDETQSYKGEIISYSGRHGGYYPDKGPLLDVGTVSIELKLPLKQIPKRKVCDYARHIERQLQGVGKLWAVESCGDLIWTYARLKEKSRNYDVGEVGVIKLSVAFDIIDGVWRRADPVSTFLEPYELCRFDDYICNHCKDEMKCPTPCDSCVVDQCNHVCERCANGECCDDNSNLISLCDSSTRNFSNQCQDIFAKKCGQSHRVVENCAYARTIYGYAALWGEQHNIDRCTGLLKLDFCSSTLYDSQEVEVKLVGCFTNPEIQLNDSFVKLNGSYDGAITINALTNEITYTCDKIITDNGVSILDQLDEKSGIPLLSIRPGNNHMLVRGGCKDRNSSVYIKHERLY